MSERGSGQQARLSDVARKARVSVSTAARVLRGSSYPVAPELQKRVRDAAEKLRYVPNLLAKKLRGGEHPSLGLIVGNMRDPHFGQIVAAYIALRDDATPRPTADDLRRFVADRLAAYKVPERITIMPEMPLNASVKVDRKKLHALILAGRPAAPDRQSP